jgi:hypothetical protein
VAARERQAPRRRRQVRDPWRCAAECPGSRAEFDGRSCRARRARPRRPGARGPPETGACPSSCGAGSLPIFQSSHSYYHPSAKSIRNVVPRPSVDCTLDFAAMQLDNSIDNSTARYRCLRAWSCNTGRKSGRAYRPRCQPRCPHGSSRRRSFSTVAPIVRLAAVQAWPGHALSASSAAPAGAGPGRRVARAGRRARPHGR